MKNARRTAALVLSAAMLLTAPAVSAEEMRSASELAAKWNPLLTDGTGAGLDSFIRDLSLEELDGLLAYLQQQALTAPQAQSVVGSGSCGQNLKWSLAENGVLTISGSGSMLDFSSNNLAPWFSRRASIKRVVVEQGVAKIGSFAFYGCQNLADAVMPASVTEIGWAAFLGCGSLQGVPSSAGLEKLGGLAFAQCGGMQGIVLPDSLDSIPFGAFYACENISSAVLPAGLTAMGEKAFYGCTSLRYAALPDSLAEIGAYAYAKCRNLEPVTLPKNLKTVPEGMFFECTGLTGVSFPGQVEEIGKEAFSGCVKLPILLLPDSVVKIGSGAFRNCKVITQLNLPKHLEEIEGEAFVGCTGLKELQIPATVSKIGERAFSQSGIRNLTFGKDAPAMDASAVDGLHVTIHYPCTGQNWDALLTQLPEGTNADEVHPEGGVKSMAAAEPGCTQPGNAAGTRCDACGQWLRGGEEIPALGHDFQMMDGVSVCVVCGEQEKTAEEPAAQAEGISEEAEGPEDALSEQTEPETAPIEPEAEAEQTEPEAVPEETEAEAEQTEAREEPEPAEEEPGEEAEPAEETEEEPVEEPEQLEDAPCLSLERKHAVPGGLVELDLTIDHNPGVASVVLTVEYDPEVLTLEQVTDTGMLPGGEHPENRTGPVRLCWVNDTVTTDLTENGILAKLQFRVAENADDGAYAVVLKCRAEDYDIMNCALEAVDFRVEDGEVAVRSVVIGDVNGDGMVNNLDRAALSRYLAGWSGYTADTLNLSAADVNGDGAVNNLDRAILARHLIGWKGYESLPMHEE